MRGQLLCNGESLLRPPVFLVSDGQRWLACPSERLLQGSGAEHNDLQDAAIQGADSRVLPGASVQHEQHREPSNQMYDNVRNASQSSELLKVFI